MKQLTDSDIEKMADAQFAPDFRAVNKEVRANLRLSHLVPAADAPLPRHAVLDLHQRTEEQAWDAIMSLATSGVRQATIITGASGILRRKFPQWVAQSILTPYVLESRPINNGSFYVRFRRMK